LLEAEDAVPATVLFVPVGQGVRTAILEPYAIDIVQVLESSGPLRFDDLQRKRPFAEADAVAQMCGDLADIGLAAIV
jgi:hypothetical protein